MPENLTVFIVDDDAAVRDSLALMLGLGGFRTATFASAEAFLAAHQKDWSGCAIADLRLPGRSGLELQAELKARQSALPFIIVSAHGDVPTARSAFLAEAVDFLEKPFDERQLRAAIETAFSRERRRVKQAQRREGDSDRYASLTPREHEVLRLATRGLHAKEIGAKLGISPRTVEVHKTRIMAKLDVRNVAELVRFTFSLDRPADDA